MRMRTEIN